MKDYIVIFNRTSEPYDELVVDSAGDTADEAIEVARMTRSDRLPDHKVWAVFVRTMDFKGSED